jgi:monothiol glutaredoxin
VTDETATNDAVTYAEKIQSVIDGSEVALFMKGTPDAIMCGNSERALGALRRAGAPITAVDVLLDMQIRDELTAISGWPTIPQVFVKGELVGGADIIEDMERTGELEQTLTDKLGENYWDARGEHTVVLVEG